MYICFDIGGTRIKAAWVSSTGKHGKVYVCATPKRLEDTKETILEIIEKIKKEAPLNIKAIGIASAGPLDWENRKYLMPVHLPHLSNFDMGAFLENKTGLPIFMENDAQAAAMGELWLGCLRSEKDAIFITLGTGVGSGVIKDSKIWRANHITGPELGHIYMGLGEDKECGCGQKGCAETYLGKDALMELFFDAGIKISSLEEGILKVKKKEHGTEKIMQEYGKRLGIFLSMLLVVFGIKVIGIGGGLSVFLPYCETYVWNTLKERFKKRSWWLPQKIVKAQNPENSALLGMAAILNQYF